MDSTPQVLRLASGVELPSLIEPGTRLHVADHYSPSATIIERLRLIHHHLLKEFGIGLVDPTGLLGVESSTTQTPDVIAKRVITEGSPVGANLAAREGATKRRARQPVRAFND